MSEKKVILLKDEYDKMETELKNLREVVSSRTVTKIVIPTPNMYYTYITYNTQVNYVIGTDENETIKEISNELESEKSKNQELTDTVYDQNKTIGRLTSNNNSWKKLPWYKRLFYID